MNPSPGYWEREPGSDSGKFLYIPFVNRIDLLQKAITSVRDNRDIEVVVVDQSSESCAKKAHDGPVFRWTAPLHFSRTMNWIQQDAVHERRLPYFLFMHSDAEVTPGGPGALCGHAEQLNATQVRWGMIFTAYDALAVFNSQAVLAVGQWDESFKWYVSDVDYYNRLRWGHWAPQFFPSACAIHHVSSTLSALTAGERRQVELDHQWAIDHYIDKWGCHWTANTEGRIWTEPYNGTESKPG